MCERSSVAKWAGMMVLAMAMTAAVQAQQPAAEADAAAAELKRGRLLYIQCRACHELKAGEPHKVGPNLHGIMDRKVAAAQGFAYSAALKGASLVWNRETFDKWLEKPSAVVPGNSMAFAGIASPKDRAALIAYIAAESK
ncbi:MAG: c-type cytochrome [Steroidobacteraceae bacterium]|nr:c-type cytochrome [Nevskiaceae bacterium]